MNKLDGEILTKIRALGPNAMPGAYSEAATEVAIKWIEKALFNYRDRLLEAQLMNDGALTITHITTCFAHTKEELCKENGLTEF
jgi:hypothetical protein